MNVKRILVVLALPILLTSCVSPTAIEEKYDPDIELMSVGWDYAASEYPQFDAAFNLDQSSIYLIQSPDRQCLHVAAYNADNLTFLENAIKSQPIFQGYTYWVLHSTYNDSSGILFTQNQNAECVTIAQDYYNGNFTQTATDTSSTDITSPEASSAANLLERLQKGESAWEVESGAQSVLHLQGIFYAPGPSYGSYSCEVWVFDNYAAAETGVTATIISTGKFVSIGEDSSTGLGIVVLSDAMLCACTNDVAKAGVSILRYVSTP